jgi:hypothetical protein
LTYHNKCNVSSILFCLSLKVYICLLAKKYLVIVVLFLLHLPGFSQTPVQDTIYLMNGHVVGEKVIDSLLGAITIANPKKPSKRIHFELSQLYMVRYSNGIKRYYYQQDTALNNYFTRDEMWMYMKGEVDSRRGFKPVGSIIGSGIAGLAGGLTGTFWGPIAPYGFMAMVGLPRVKIKGQTVSNPNYIDSDGYILGYERVARHKRRVQSVFSGSIGLVLGYTIYGLFHQHYPENVDFGLGKK